MRALRRKLRREIWRLRWPALAIALVMSAGVALVVMSVSTLRSLVDSRARFYAACRFPEAFISLKRAPRIALDRVRSIPGVAVVEGRVVTGATLDVPGLAEPATARVVSLPDEGEPELGRLYLRSGRFLKSSARHEVLVAEAFATAHQLHPGSTVTLIIRGRRLPVQIAGIVLSPEYVYSVRPGELIPDDRRYGVFWMSYRELAAASDLDGAYNNICVSLLPGGSLPLVLRRLDDLLARYGGAGAYGRERQPSHRFLENELIQLRTMALVPPALFLAVTSFLLSIVLSRVVELQRESIATLRAFGYTRGEVVWHFIQFALLIGLTGLALGIAVGVVLGRDLTQLYTEFFHLPEFWYRLDFDLVVLVTTASLASAAAGASRAVSRAARLQPAEAMQPEPPAEYRQSWLEWSGWQGLWSPIARIVARQLQRGYRRAALSALGIALAIGILILGSFLEDTVRRLMEFQFSEVHRYDAIVTLTEVHAERAARSLGRLPAVLSVEPFRVVPVTISHLHHQRRLELWGLPEQPRLLRVVDATDGPIPLANRGLVLSRRLGEILECRPGDYVRVTALEGPRATVELPVTRLVDDYLDLNAYLPVTELRRLMGEQDTVSGALLTLDSRHTGELYAALKQLPQVAGVSLRRAVLESYEKTMAENILRMRTMNVIFASVVAVGVIYNCGRITLAERSRDLATLRVLGFTRREVAQILWGELAIPLVAAIPLGAGLGYLFAWSLTAALATEIHRFPLTIHPRTYVFAMLVAIASSLAVFLVLRRQVDRLALVEALKARD